MAKIDVLDILRTKQMNPLEFDFDNLWIPPMNTFLSPRDVEALRKIATSIKLSSKLKEKYRMIDEIMVMRGFKRFSAGTNRVVYKFYEDDRFVVKIAIDKVGMQDNPREYENQFLLKPYVTKMFYISPCGTVGFSERVLPIKNKAEFKEIAGDVFDILVNRVLGKYVMEDVGSKYFMNWGVRKFVSPVLLDYPYLYKLDGKKLFCTKVDPITNEMCNGEIDYDRGFNHLVCSKCGKIYLASDLRDNNNDNKIIIKGGIQMKIALKIGDRIISEPIPTDEVMKRPNSVKSTTKSNGIVVGIDKGDGKIIIVSDTAEKKEQNLETVDKDEEVVTEEKSCETASNSEESSYSKETETSDSVEEESVSKPEEEQTPQNTIEVRPSINTDESETNNMREDETDTTLEYYDDYEDERTYKKQSSRRRDPNGRFVSNSSQNKVRRKDRRNKLGSTFIPSRGDDE